MCVIIHKPAGIELPQEIAEKALNINKDGWGIMWHEKDHLEIRKGFKKKNFLRYVKALKDKNAIFHARISTHGEVNLKNCHPYEVTPDTWMMHNGTMGVDLVETGMSDSYNFATYLVGPILMTYPDLFGTTGFEKTLKYIIGGSNKLCFMRADGEVWIVNKSAGTMHEGMWFSNQGPLPSKLVEHRPYTGYYSEGKGNRWWDNDIRPYCVDDTSHYCNICKIWKKMPENMKWSWTARDGYTCFTCEEKIKEMKKNIEEKKEVKALMPPPLADGNVKPEEQQEKRREIIRKVDLGWKEAPDSDLNGWPEDLEALALLGKKAITSFVNEHPEETAELIDEFGYLIDTTVQ